MNINCPSLNAAAHALAKAEGIAPNVGHYLEAELDALRQQPVIIAYDAAWKGRNGESVRESWRRAFRQSETDPYRR